ncbi:RdgB/HAM1 family non-canonical purine NTP pyrophosphatase [Alicyclobacillus sp. SP_1]|jgi:XTP/dITP diphosphohydrolase|uniref:RdgB/HAM1 family non-canonical purine NTP pyrophosphatase n=1 Tax=Alicyclobacillus sp. SP_1 TaxID=2942475 RepID=UPI002803E3D0|nr:RdgB/HAM1 family non-canonical purine NTP pyrophosphatase [Alicyclobacillus sp. SP_1]
MMEVCIASQNRHKVREFEEMLHGQLLVRSLPDGLPEAPEDGTTFAENALQKARFYAALVQMPVLADDSGLCVASLHGEPGVLSARYAGVHGDDEANNAKLLRRLAEHAEDRSAEFVCALALVSAAGQTLCSAIGTMSGEIALEPRGAHGFGYDPLFILPHLGRTFAELSPPEKQAHSHRKAALDALLAKLPVLDWGDME